MAQAWLTGFEARLVIADKGYDTEALIEWIEAHEAQTVIPLRANRVVQRDNDWEVYKQRIRDERFINKLKQYRRGFSRFDKLAKRFLGFIHFAGPLIWLR